MKNYFCIIALMAIILGGCSSRGEDYYRQHPERLQEAMGRCPENPPRGLTCEELAVLGKKMTLLAQQLQMDPQGFGKKILALQNILAENINTLRHHPHAAPLEKECHRTEHDLETHLAVVRWLESPVS